MSSPLKTLVQEYGWIHTGLGLLGNVAFFVGSVVFLPSLEKWEAVGVEWQTVGVWLFIFGSFFMLVGTAGNLLVKVYEAREKKGS
tara:strand:+ start:114 stop:368 length:255 start_codon:yes stop_codon:yes gene_type:complete